MLGTHPDQLKQNPWGLDLCVLKLLGDLNNTAEVENYHFQAPRNGCRFEESRVQGTELCDVKPQAWLFSYTLYNLGEVNLASSLK